MIICACISALGISVRLGWFRSCVLSRAMSLNQLFLQTNFTAVILINRSAHCDFLFSKELCKFNDVWVRKTKYKTNFPLEKIYLTFIIVIVNNQTNKIAMFCICHIIDGFKLFIYSFTLLGLLCVFLKVTVESMEE